MTYRRCSMTMLLIAFHVLVVASQHKIDQVAKRVNLDSRQLRTAFHVSKI